MKDCKGIDPSVRQVIEKDPCACFMGIRLLELKPGYARAEMTVGDHQLNFHGVTHGGAVFSLADAVFAAASNSRGQVALALNVNISFLKATTRGVRLEATAAEENLTPRTALYRITVKDDEGALVAVAQGIVYRKQTPLAVEKKGN